MLQYVLHSILHFIKGLRKGSHTVAPCSWPGAARTLRGHVSLRNVWSQATATKTSSFLVELDKAILKIGPKDQE